MIDVLVTQHSKWTARRVRRSLFVFGQSLVDFTADPWVGIKGQNDYKTTDLKMKKKSKATSDTISKESGSVTSSGYLQIFRTHMRFPTKISSQCKHVTTKASVPSSGNLQKQYH